MINLNFSEKEFSIELIVSICNNVEAKHNYVILTAYKRMITFVLIRIFLMFLKLDE